MKQVQHNNIKSIWTGWDIQLNDSQILNDKQMIEILRSTELWTFLGVVATGVIGFIAGKRKNAAEAEGIEVDNDKEILNTYKAELEYFSKQLVLTRKEISELRDELAKLLKASCSRTDCIERLK